MICITIISGYVGTNDGTKRPSYNNRQVVRWSLDIYATITV